MNAKAPDPSATPDPFANFRNLHTALRNNLQVTRQLTRGEPVYVVYDPVSFQAHRLSLNDYRVVSELNETRSLETCFQKTVASGFLPADSEADYYRFVAKLDALGLLTTSSVDGDTLFKRFTSRVAAERKNRILSILFLTIPLTNPDRFLTRSMRRFEFLFTRTAFLIWAVSLVLACAIVAVRWSDFVEPLNSILAVKNLLFMSAAFVGLKIWHELGHGFACKHFGGRVPEMGCKLIIGMPLAYVDASSAWSFPKRFNRILVMLGGMYFESLVAIPSAFLWALYPDSFIGSCAYQLIFMAGVATIFFNANPLMRYDGYFVLSDLLGIPNLRARATQEVYGTLKKYTLGLPYASSYGWKDRLTLLCYGISATLYSATLILSIALLIATRFQVLGLVLAAFQLGAMLLKNSRKLFTYLLKAEETATVRPRAKRVAYMLGFGLPLALLFLPVPHSVQLPGLVTAEQTSLVRADTAGTIAQIPARVGTVIETGSPLVQLSNDDTTLAHETALIASDAMRRSAHFIARQDLGEGRKSHFQADETWARSLHAASNKEKLTIRAPHGGQLVFISPDYEVGKFLNIGDPVAKIVQGKTMVRAWLDEDQLAAAHIHVGSPVRVRVADNSTTSLMGRVESVAPVNTSEFEDLALTTVGEGSIPYDTTTKSTTRPMFQMRVSLPDHDSDRAFHDARAYLLIGRKYDPLGAWLVRITRKFANTIFAG